MRRVVPMLLALTIPLFAPTMSGCSLIQPPATLSVVQEDVFPDLIGNFKTLRVTVNNASSAVARGVTVHDILPAGFTYVSTQSTAGDAIRTRTIDPPINTPTPTWSAWSIPAGSAKTPAQLILVFQVTVGRAPSKTPNRVEVTADNSDLVAAKPAVLSVKPTPALDLSVSSRTPVAAGSEAEYTINVRNTGTAGADPVFVSAVLPSGFIYNGTKEISGNSLRTGAVDPLANSLLPSWGTWSMPAVGNDGTPGLLKIVFAARVLSDEPAGAYGISVTITFNNLPAQTVADQAVVQVIRA